MLAGAGAAGRAVDITIALRAHEAGEPGHPVIVRETVSRTFADLTPAVFRWEHPTWVEAEELDPADLARPGGRWKKKDVEPPAPSHTADWLAEAVLEDSPQTRDAVLAGAIAGGVPNINQAEKLLGQAEGGKLAYRWKLPKDRRTFFAAVPQPALLSDSEE